MPPLAEAFTLRADSVPGIEAVVVPGAVVALVPEPESAGHPDGWRRSCGKTQLAAYLAGLATWFVPFGIQMVLFPWLVAVVLRMDAFAVGVALAVAGFAAAGTANVSDATSTLQIPAIDNALAGSHPVPYTPVCSSSHGGSALTVCVHPAYRGYLPQVTAALDQVTGELSGLPGLPAQASQALPATVPPEAVPPSLEEWLVPLREKYPPSTPLDD